MNDLRSYTETKTENSKSHNYSLSFDLFTKNFRRYLEQIAPNYENPHEKLFKYHETGLKFRKINRNIIKIIKKIETFS